MCELKILTNNKPRPIVYGYELSTKERKEFDWMDEEELNEASFVRYLGNTYCLNEFEVTRDGPWTSYVPEFKGWDGKMSDSFFSGILIRYVPDSYSEEVVMGRYFC